MRLFTRIPLSILSLVLLPLAMAMAAQSPAGDGLAVVNLDLVFEKSTLVAHRSGQLRAVVQEVQSRLESMNEEVKNLETEVNIRPATHPRHAEFREQLEIAKLRRDLYRDRQATRIQGQEMELLRQSYEDMRQLLAEFARERQLRLLMLVSEGPIEASNVQSMRIQMGQRSVLYFAPELNVSEDFLTFANGRFRGADGAGSGPTPPANQGGN